MIAQLRGTIVHSGDQQAVLDVQGVGYAVHVSGRTQGQIATMSGEVTLLTEMQVREDSMTLFGFLDLGERDAFRLLITVQGVGAKAAMAILSVLAPHDLTTAIIAGDKAMVARADGVGPKIAQRVVNELGEKIGKISSLGGALAIGDAGGVSGGLCWRRCWCGGIWPVLGCGFGFGQSWLWTSRSAWCGDAGAGKCSQ